MKKNAKRAVAVLFSILGTVMGLYIGGEYRYFGAGEIFVH